MAFKLTFTIYSGKGILEHGGNNVYSPSAESGLSLSTETTTLLFSLTTYLFSPASRLISNVS